jgi:hypothetical protein
MSEYSTPAAADTSGTPTPGQVLDDLRSLPEQQRRGVVEFVAAELGLALRTPRS